MTDTPFVSWSLPRPTHKTLLGAAEDWTRLGYRIHRCYPEDAEGGKGKKPIGKWKDKWNQARSKTELTEMFDPGSYYDQSLLMCIIVPVGMVIFDFDNKPSEGLNAIETLRAFCEHFQLPLDKNNFPMCPVVETPSGGLHLYYTLPEGFIAKNWVKSPDFPVPGIDIRTSGGGVALVPPSKRKSGKTYKWRKWFKTVPQATPEMVEGLTPPTRDEEIGERRAYRPRPEGLHPYVKATFENVIDRLESTGKGGRNNALLVATRSLAQWVGGGEIHPSEAKQALRGTAIYHELCQDDGKEATENTIMSGWRLGLAEPRNAPERSGEPSPERTARNQKLAERQEARKAANDEDAPEVRETPEWVIDWQEGQPIKGTRVAMLLGQMGEDQSIHHHVRQKPWQSPSGNASGHIMMRAYRDPDTRQICGIEQTFVSSTGAVGNTRTFGRPFRGICHLKTGTDIIILGTSVATLMEVFKVYRSFVEGKNIGVALLNDAEVLNDIQLTGLPKEVIVVLEKTLRGVDLIQLAAKNNGRDGYKVSAAWIEPLTADA